MDCLSYAKRTAPLDPNHTHFILVDDGTTAKFGREIKFRAALERFISDTGLIGLSQTQCEFLILILLEITFHLYSSTLHEGWLHIHV